MEKEIIQAKKILEVEANAVLRASDRLGSNFSVALRLLQSTAKSGRKIIVVGMGKSHYVAAKIAASFMSTGLTAVFLHPAEAIHGDLGIVAEGDLCILISKSGSTPEILALLPYLKSKTKLLAIIGEAKSPIGEVADCVLDASVEREACPINLLPTASTTVALALGDALVATYARVDGLNPEKFAGFHPGGSLGKRLLKEITEVMLPIERVPLGTGVENLKKAAELMSEKPVGALCVINKERQLTGIVVDGDLRRALAQGLSMETSIEKLLIRNPVTLTAGLMVNEAIATFEREGRKITSAPVVDAQGRLLGFARIHDLL